MIVRARIGWGSRASYFGLLHGVAWLLAGQILAAPATPDDVRRALHFRDFVKAAELTDEGLAGAPGDPAWRLAQANSLAALGRLTEALAEVRAILQEHPGEKGARIREAQLLSQLGRLTTSAASYQQCRQDFPEDPDVALGLGLVHMWLGRFVEAEAWLDEASRQRTTRESAVYAQLRLLIASGRYREAWVEARALDQNGDLRDPELGLLRASMLQRIGQYEACRDLADRPGEDPELRRRQAAFLARLEIRHRAAGASMEAVREMAALDPPDYDALILAGDVLAEADRRPEGRIAYLRATRVTPERPEAWMGLARLASRDGRLSGALALYRQIVTENPEALEAWLGLVRTAQLMDDSVTAQEALSRAHALAPGSAYVLREELHQALLDGDLVTFRERLKWFREAQPDDAIGRLWGLRMRVQAGDELDEREWTALLDPLAPRETALLLKLGSKVGYRLDEWLVRLGVFEQEDLNRAARGALSEQLSVLLQPTLAQELAGRGLPERADWLRALASGWWAYATMPIAHGQELELDQQALTVWLARELHHRFRLLTVETGSAIYGEWLLARADWYERWRDRWFDPAAAVALREVLLGLGEGWSTGPDLQQVAVAWQASEAGGPESPEAMITWARWRLHRHDPSGALKLWRRLQQLEPSRQEPIQGQVQALRAAGRLREAAVLLRTLCRSPGSDPGIRLAYVDLLRRLGRWAEAREQLKLLSEEVFDEPELYRQTALLAEAEGKPAATREEFERGLRRHPRAAILFGEYARFLLGSGQLDDLVAAFQGLSVPPWTDARQVSVVADRLTRDRRGALQQSPRWWFSWTWLDWYRLPERSSWALQARARALAEQAAVRAALAVLQPALDAGLPDSDLWLQGARLLDFNRRYEESARAFGRAMHLGCGRLDAEVLRLSREAQRNPGAVARQLARRLAADPDQRAVRVGLVYALLRAGEVGAADRALAPLMEEDPSDPEVRMLAAQLRAAQGRVRQARSLHESLLREDPLAADSRAARRALDERNELGMAVGYEYQFRSDRSGLETDATDWQEAYVSAFWRRPYSVTTSVEYRWFERYGDVDHQVAGSVAAELDSGWIGYARGAVGIDPDYTSVWRAGLGLSRALAEPIHAGLHGNYLRFTGLDVWQLVPTIVWRWHPRGTAEGRLYLGHNQIDGGPSQASWTGLLNLSWQLGQSSLVVAHGAWGDQNAADPTLDVIGSDTFQSYGLRLRLGWRHRWTLEPAYRFDRYERFDLHAVGLSLGYTY